MNLSVNNRSKKERKKKGERYLSTGGGVYGEVRCSRLWLKCQALTAEWRSIPSLLSVLSAPTITIITWHVCSELMPPRPLHTCIHMHFTLLSPYRVEFKKSEFIVKMMILSVIEFWECQAQTCPKKIDPHKNMQNYCEKKQNDQYHLFM